MANKQTPVPAQPDLVAAALLWLLGGNVLLLSTAVPLRSELLGWTPAFWLLAAPLIMLLALQPSLPRQLKSLCRPRRRAMCSVAWHGCPFE